MSLSPRINHINRRLSPGQGRGGAKVKQRQVEAKLEQQPQPPES